jgi:MscS family membrane protein
MIAESTTEQETPAATPEEVATPEDFFNLDIDLEPLLPENIVPVWGFLQDYPVLLFVLMFGLGYLLGKVLQTGLRAIFHQASKRTQSTLDDQFYKYLTEPVVETTVILALVAAIKAFEFSESLDWFLVRMMFTLLLFFWGRAWFRATSLAIKALSRRDNPFELFQPRTRPLFEMSIKFILFGILIWLFMAFWSIDGTAWLASAGVVGIAVGFAAKDTLANLISGVSIIADAPYKLGDYIVLDTGERGVVTELGMRSTRLLTRDDVEISIPNAVEWLSRN